MSEDAQQDAPQDGATEQTAEVQAAQDVPAEDGVPQEVKDYIEARIARLVANGQIQPPPSA